MLVSLGLLAVWTGSLAQAANLEAQPQPSNTSDDRESDESERSSIGITAVNDLLVSHLADPEEARLQVLEELEKSRSLGNTGRTELHARVLKQIESIRRPRQVRLSLEDVLRRTLANNYTIQTISYNPAIEATRVIEAEAAFDAVFFANIRNQKIDQPTANTLSSTGAEFFSLSSGVRKLLPAGAVVTGRYDLRRSKQNFAFQTLNPAYTSNLVLDVRQPLLRNFGIDVNRSVILLRNNSERISRLAFRRQVRDTLRQAEELYWRLVQARRDVVITAREIGGFEEIYQYLLARRDFDILPVNIFATQADLELAKVDFVRRRAIMFDAEDRLIATINDPQLNLTEDVELIPTDFPLFDRIVVDPLAEVQTALEERPEIREEELQVLNAKISVGQARNAELPQLDLAVTMTLSGLSGTADRSFDEVSRSNFITYDIGVNFEIPIGNRGPRTTRRRAELQHSQARANLQRVIEEIILDVHLAVRQLETTYNQIEPSFASVKARQRELESHVARAERKDIGTLNTELGAMRALAGTRRTALNAIVTCNLAVIDLERSKGTLLKYNNVVIPTPESETTPP